jgi:DAK2 domain fusion protein YloV
LPPSLDASVVRAWCRLSLQALGRAREEIDAINVYPVADGDTGTNLFLTVESATQAVEAVFDAHGLADAAACDRDRRPTLAEAFRAMSHGALIGARGNSGTILAQLLRGMNTTITSAEERAEGRSAAGAAGRDEIGGAGRPGPGGSAGAGTPGASGGAGQVRAHLAGRFAAGEEPAGAGAEGEGGRAGARGPGGSAAVVDRDHAAARVLRRALRVAAESAYEAVARPVEGTMLTVATRAADAAEAAAGGLVEVARAAHAGARAALAQTPGQLGVLRRAGVVDAGGLGLVAVLGALADAVSGDAPMGPLAGTAAGAGTSYRHTHEPAEAGPAAEDVRSGRGHGHVVPAHPEDSAPDAAAPRPGGGLCSEEGHAAGDGPGYEVVYLLEGADDVRIGRLRGRLAGLGDSLVVVGGDGLWNVHVHVDDVGAAIEAGIEAGRPYRIRVTHFRDQARRPGPRGERAVVAVVRGEGLAGLCAGAGATVVAVRPGEQPASGEIAAAIRRAHAREVVLLPNDAELRHAAGAAAERARDDGVRVALIPTRSPVQGLAALAVHEPSRRFDEDVVAMTSAAGATRYAELAVAEHRSWTMAGVCQAGAVLGLIDGDVAVIGEGLAETAAAVLDRMLAAGGELVTLVLGATAPPDLAERVESHVRDHHLAVDTVTYEGGHPTSPLLIGVE